MAEPLVAHASVSQTGMQVKRELKLAKQVRGNVKAAAAFGYFGSKKRIARTVLENLPPHSAWVELFCGSAALTLAKEPAPIEVINDLDDRIVNLFRVLRSRPKALRRQLELTPYARVELEVARERRNHLGKVERARQFLVECMMAMNGIVGQDAGGFSCSASYARNGREARVNRWHNLPEKLAAVVERLRSVRVDHKDARALLAEFADRPGTLIYMDPPYLAERTNGYREEANDERFHRDLLTLANKAKCMIFISGYDHSLYRKLLTRKGGWKRREIHTTTRDSSGRDHERTEVVWMNEQFVRAQKMGRVPLRLSRQERTVGKVNPSR